MQLMINFIDEFFGVKKLEGLMLKFGVIAPNITSVFIVLIMGFCWDILFFFLFFRVDVFVESNI